MRTLCLLLSFLREPLAAKDTGSTWLLNPLNVLDWALKASAEMINMVCATVANKLVLYRECFICLQQLSHSRSVDFLKYSYRSAPSNTYLFWLLWIDLHRKASPNGRNGFWELQPVCKFIALIYNKTRARLLKDMYSLKYVILIALRIGERTFQDGQLRQSNSCRKIDQGTKRN